MNPLTKQEMYDKLCKDHPVSDDYKAGVLAALEVAWEDILMTNEDREIERKRKQQDNAVEITPAVGTGNIWNNYGTIRFIIPGMF